MTSVSGHRTAVALRHNMSTPQHLPLQRTTQLLNGTRRGLAMSGMPGLLQSASAQHGLRSQSVRFHSRVSSVCSPRRTVVPPRQAMALICTPILPTIHLMGRPTSPQRRFASTGPVGDGTYEAVVVGGGPAGITVVGNLLEQKIEPILWVDNAFNGGRVNRCYREVPSNTKVCLFVDFATAVEPFREIVSDPSSLSKENGSSSNEAVTVSGKGDKLQFLRDLDQGKGCQLSYAADMCLILTEGLRKSHGIESRQARVTQAVLNDNTSTWTVKLSHDAQSSEQPAEVQAKRLVLCTGSSPNNESLDVDVPNLQTLDLDCALAPTKLVETLAPLGPTTVAVIGASHSAILVLMNLYNLASSTKADLRIKWFTRHPLRYAEYKDGWILRDNTGLKGAAAEWAKNNLEPETFGSSDVSKYITKVAYERGAEKQTFEEHLQGCDFHVQAIGYSRDPIPELKTRAGEEITPVYDHETGKFSYSIEGGQAAGSTSVKPPTMFGAGIAWPERVTDPLGNVEYAVGFFKFMKFVKRVIPDWR